MTLCNSLIDRPFHRELPVCAADDRRGNRQGSQRSQIRQMKVLFDTNLWISFMIGRRLSSLAEVLNRRDVEVYVSEQLLDEIRNVVDRPKFGKLIEQ